MTVYAGVEKPFVREPTFADHVAAVIVLAERAHMDDKLARRALEAVCRAASGYDDAKLTEALDDLDRAVGDLTRFRAAPDVAAVVGEHGTFEGAETLLEDRVHDAAVWCLGGERRG